MERKRGLERAAVGRARVRASALAFAILAVAIAPPAIATTYKWVDDKGVTHYSDKLPAEAVNRGSTELDRQALPMKKVDPAATPEQIRARQMDAERAKDLARQQEVQVRRDRALMQSYASESEIDLARNRALMTIDAQIESATAFIAQLTKRRDALMDRRSKVGAKGLPPAEERELETTLVELAKQQALVEQRQKERDTAVTRYAADKARWRELRPLREAKDGASTAPARAAAPAVLPASGAPPIAR